MDVATKTLSVALLEDEALRNEVFQNTNLHHSTALLPAVEYVLKSAGSDMDAVDLFCCTTGPGSFTGVRMGLATVKGFALASGRPVAAVSTLDALAGNIETEGLDICPMLDARKNQVYMSLIRNHSGAQERVGEERVLSAEELVAAITTPTIFVGDGALKFASLLTSRAPQGSIIAPEHLGHIRAEVVGRLGIRMFRGGKVVDPVSVAPRYLRASEAEMGRARAG